jgi:hypothetical protein
MSEYQQSKRQAFRDAEVKYRETHDRRGYALGVGIPNNREGRRRIKRSWRGVPMRSEDPGRD